MPIRIVGNQLSQAAQQRYETTLDELRRWLEVRTAIRTESTDDNPSPGPIEFDEAEIHDAPHTSMTLWDMQTANHVTIRLTNQRLRARGEWYTLHWRRENDGSSVLSPGPDNESSHTKKRKRKKRGTNTETTKDHKKNRDDEEDEDGDGSAPKRMNAGERRLERRRADRAAEAAKEAKEQESGTSQGRSGRDHESRRLVVDSSRRHVSSGRKHEAEEEDLVSRYASLSFIPSTETSRKERHSRR